MPGRIDRERHAQRVFIITGAGSGIGAATALRLAAEGAAVVVADIRGTLAESIAGEVRDRGGRAISVACDVAQEAGAPDGLFANAGTAGSGWIHETSLEDWNRVLAINLTGAFLCAKHVLPHFLARGGGVFLSTGSIASVIIGGGGSAASYAASKGALLQLTRQIAVDYGPRGVRAVCICPGAVKTGLPKHASEDRERQTTPRGEPLPRSRMVTPLPRVAEPDEVASTASFIFSEDASFITGAALFVDGGLTAI